MVEIEPSATMKRAHIKRSEEPQDAVLCGTMLLERYYKTGELPENEAMRKVFQVMIEKGEI